MTRFKTFAAALSLIGTIYTSPAQAASCTVNFNKQADLEDLPYSEQCTTFISNYVQSCTSSSIWLLEAALSPPGETITGYNHFHLSWEEAAINCIASDSCFGRKSGNSCLQVDHTTLPRFITSHTGDQLLWLTRIDNNGNTLQSSITQVRVRGNQNIKLYVQKANLTWLVYNNLAPGLRTLTGSGSDIKHVIIRSTNGVPYQFDDVRFEY